MNNALIRNLQEKASRIHQFPLVGKILEGRLVDYTPKDIEGFREAQRLAHNCARDVAKLMVPGMTELQVAKLLKAYLLDSGVKIFLHEPFAWFGNRTRFDGCKNYLDYFPSKRALMENEPVILDIAPVLNGRPADIGYSCIRGENADFSKTLSDLKAYRDWLPSLFKKGVTGKEIYHLVEERLKEQGYDNIHALYPLGVLGHRMHPMIDGKVPGLLRPFSWQFYWSVISRGAFSETLGEFHLSEMEGVWAIEPHLGAKGFGVKFEEMLWVHDGGAEWIEKEGVFCE